MNLLLLKSDWCHQRKGEAIGAQCVASSRTVVAIVAKGKKPHARRKYVANFQDAGFMASEHGLYRHGSTKTWAIPRIFYYRLG